ncbi:MAG: HD domain-containing protein [Desulfobulbaceae bacterium]|nr:HD domain-containing protein [Desulfobulbaceae bacterium]
MHYLALYRQETRQLHHRRVYTILLVGIGMMLLFSLLDYILVPEHFFEFFTYRLLAAGCSCLLLGANYLDQGQRRAWLIGFSGYLCTGLVILLTIHRMGGVISPYYVGLIVTMTIYTVIAPLTFAQTLISGFALVFLYLLSMVFGESLNHFQLMSLFSNLFFMVCFVFIAATQSWADTTARMQECQLRTAENEAAEALARQADNLEHEVIRRTEEQKVTEQRYRILYEAIADDVVLITPQGEIVQANNSYLRHFGNGTQPKRASFFNAVRAQDREKVQAVMFDLFEREMPMAAWQVTLLSDQGDPVEAEISGALLTRGEKKLGLQLVIRDIGIRKRLEEKLIASLSKVRQVENAAILALAKLSEYRDVTPGQHLERIREYSKVIATELAGRPEYRDVITAEYIQNLYQGVILHDIGKVAITDEILEKNGPLTADEEQRLRHHTLAGGNVIKAMEEEAGGAGFLSLAKNIAFFHHERWDGKGYPYGLQGVEIPLEARIMALVDTYEALTTIRDTERALAHQSALDRIVAGAGGEFDPLIVHAFLMVQEEFDRIRAKLAETC